MDVLSRIPSSLLHLMPKGYFPRFLISNFNVTKTFSQISDQGGGIFQDKLDKVWRYGFTTVSDDLVDLSCSTTSANLLIDGLGARFERFQIELNEPHMWRKAHSTGRSRDPMAGLGFGLPLTRVYARYFGGDLQLISIPNFGTDVFLKITRLEQVKAQCVWVNWNLYYFFRSCSVDGLLGFCRTSMM